MIVGDRDVGWVNNCEMIPTKTKDKYTLLKKLFKFMPKLFWNQVGEKTS